MTDKPSSVASTPGEICNTGGILIPQDSIWAGRVDPLLRTTLYLLSVAEHEKCAFAKAYLADVAQELEQMKRRAQTK